ncbi:unnamed protein product [Cochlearia groenlandica]
MDYLGRQGSAETTRQARCVASAAVPCSCFLEERFLQSDHQTAGSIRSVLKMTNAAVSTARQDRRRRHNDDCSQTFTPAVTRQLDQTAESCTTHSFNPG